MSDNDNSVNIDPRPRDYHHGDLRAALVDAGLKRLKSGSVAALSLREVARDVGVSATAVYRHFPDKAALLAELCKRGAAELAATQAEAMTRAGGGQKGFLATGGAYVRYAVANPALFRLMMAHMPSGGLAGSDASDDQALRLLRENVSALLPEGASEEERLYGMAMSWAQVHGLAMLMLDGQMPVSEDLISAFESGVLELHLTRNHSQPSE